MKTSIPRTHLAEAIKAVKPAINTRSGLNVLTHTLITVDGEHVTLSGTNLEQTIRATVPAAEPHAEGRVLVPLATLSKIVTKLDGDDVTLIAEDGKLHVQSGDADVRLSTGDLDDYPPLPEPGKPSTALTATLLPRIGHLTGATETGDTRPVLTGVMFSKGRIAATDSCRLAWLDTRHGLEGLVPADTLEAVRKAKPLTLEGSQDSDSQITFHGATKRLQIQWTTRLIEGRFPDVAQLLPDEHAGTVTADAGKLGKVVDRIAAASDGNAFEPMVQLAFDGGALLTVSGGRDGHEAEESVPCTVDGAVPDMIAFNPKYLAFALSCFDGDVTANMRDELKPVVFRGADDGYGHLLMPVRT